MPKKPKCWSHAEGEKGATVTVYERRPGGLLYARAFDPTRRAGKGGYVRRSLKHRDQDRAKTYALEQAAKLCQGQNEVAQAKTTLARLLASYQRHRRRGRASEIRERISAALRCSRASWGHRKTHT